MFSFNWRNNRNQVKAESYGNWFVPNINDTEFTKTIKTIVNSMLYMWNMVKRHVEKRQKSEMSQSDNVSQCMNTHDIKDRSCWEQTRSSTKLKAQICLQQSLSNVRSLYKGIYLFDEDKTEICYNHPKCWNGQTSWVTLPAHTDKVYSFCSMFVSLLYEIMWNTCVTLIYFFIMYILICTSRNLLQCCTSKSNVV